MLHRQGPREPDCATPFVSDDAKVSTDTSAGAVCCPGIVLWLALGIWSCSSTQIRLRRQRCRYVARISDVIEHDLLITLVLVDDCGGKDYHG